MSIIIDKKKITERVSQTLKHIDVVGGNPGLYETLGRCYKMLDEVMTSNKYLLMAATYYEERIQTTNFLSLKKYDRARRHMLIGRLYMLAGVKSKEESYYTNAILLWFEVLQENKSTSLTYKNALYNIAECYLWVDDYTNAFKFAEKAYTIHDSILNKSLKEISEGYLNMDRKLVDNGIKSLEEIINNEKIEPYSSDIAIWDLYYKAHNLLDQIQIT